MISRRSSREHIAVLFSGGIDSAACAHLLRKQAPALEGIHFDYGQAAADPERKAARRLARQLKIPLHEFALSPHTKRGVGELLGRNGFLISAALFLTVPPPTLIAIGVHAGTPYYDCSPAFVSGQDRLIAEQTEGRCRVIAPFVTWTKAQIVDYFKTSSLRLGDTYSCEAGTVPPCGRCLSCKDREALHVG